jgi:enoyl-CoA hydratase/carnithine racemase
VSAEVSWVGEDLATVTLAWPERRNALGPDEALELAAALESVTSARSVVLLGDGAAFCAGGDLDAITVLARQGRDAVRTAIYGAFHVLARALWKMPGITIAAVDGPAIGLGADLALLCNLRLVGSQGRLDQGWARLGLIPGTGGAWLVQRLAGVATAWDFITSAGSPWDGPALERRGLASSVEGSAAEAAIGRARRIARWPSETVQAYQALMQPAMEGYEEHLDLCLEAQTALLTGPAFLALAERARGLVPGTEESSV